jgi:PAS domain-containing protein
VWLRYRIQSRGEERVDFNTVLAEVKGQRDEAWNHIEKQDSRIATMEAEIQGLRLARDLDPFPNWITDLQGKCIFVNREFERMFLEPQGKTYRHAVGKTYEEFGWPEAFTRVLASLNAAARSRPDGTARATTGLVVPAIGPSRVTVHKFPIRFKPSGVIVAFAGFITDIVPDDETTRGGNGR